MNMAKSFKRKYFLFMTSLLLCIFLSIRSASGQFHPVAGASGIQFTIRNFGFKVGGSLASPEGDIRFNPDSLSRSFFHMTIRSESINTENAARDEHLKAEDYFDVKNYPLIHFVSDDVRVVDKKGKFLAVGRLTIKNKSKEIQLPFTAIKNGNAWLFTGVFKMNRRDFEIGGSSTISNELEVAIKVLTDYRP
jgi:polyisoprenoid-binding protein YceI